MRIKMLFGVLLQEHSIEGLLIRKYLFILGLIALCSGQLKAQFFGEYTTILKNLQRDKWERAHGQLRSALRKDSSNVIVKYLFAIYFSSPQNLNFQVDSAYHYINAALYDFRASNVKQRERIKRFPLDSTRIIKTRNKIDSIGFSVARRDNTAESYEHFLSVFSTSDRKEEAATLRDEAAYEQAIVENTYQVFLAFLDKYPHAMQASKAKDKYERLLFESATHDGRLLSYKKFLQDFPTTPYKKDVEKNIFEIYTASGEEQSFLNFIKEHPDNMYVPQAKKILFHIFMEKGVYPLPDFLVTDSLTHARELEETYLVPFFTSGKFGFMDDAGSEVFPPELDDILPEHRCGNVTDDVIALPDRILAKNGSIIFKGMIETMDDMGFGYLKVTSNEKVTVVHKSGFVADTTADDASILKGKFIAIKKERWGVFTLHGRQLVPCEWDEIKMIGDIVVFRKNDKLRLATISQIGLLADQQNTLSNDRFDDIKPWAQGRVWAKAGNYEGVFNEALDVVIPFDRHVLENTFFGAIGISASGKMVYIGSLRNSVRFDEVKINKPWLAVKQTRWRIFDLATKEVKGPAHDTIIFRGTYAIGIKKDSSNVYFCSGKNISFTKVKFEFIPGKDSLNFLLVDEGSKRSVYNSGGQRLFTGVFDNIQYVGPGFFVISKNEKKALSGMDGKYLIKPEYDAVGRISESVVSLLKNKKFGVYNTLSRIVITPRYDKNLLVYNAKFLIAYKDGKYGFIEWDDKKKYTFDFTEIQYWNDSIAWVKMNSQWMIYNILQKKILQDEIKKYEVIADVNGEKLAVVQHNDKYGVVSSKKGMLLPIDFAEIKNLGSVDTPLYFAEKHVEEAAVFIIHYFDKDGQLIKRIKCDEDEYERIYCPGR